MSGWEYTITVAGNPVNVCDVLTPLTITHGRTTAGTQPDTPSCEFDWDADTPPGQLGDLIQISTTLVGSGLEWVYDEPANYTYDSADYVWDNAWTVPIGPRFTGRIHQLQAIESMGVITGYRVLCMGTQTSWAYKPLQASRPQETDVARVTAIAQAANAPLTVIGADTITLAADDVATDAVNAWQEVCASSGGLLWQTRAGGMRYGTADHRQADPAGVIGACSIIDGLGWSLDVETIINHVTITWGPAEAQAQVTHSDDASIAEWGTRHVDAATLCATEADADQLGLMILARRARPYWVMPGVTVDASTADLPTQHLLGSIDVGSIILAPIPLEPGPVPVTDYGAWVVEGWTETADTDGTTYVSLNLSDAGRWVETRLRTWDEARAYTWAQEAAGTWLDALLVEGFTP